MRDRMRERERACVCVCLIWPFSKKNVQTRHTCLSGAYCNTLQRTTTISLWGKLQCTATLLRNGTLTATRRNMLHLHNGALSHENAIILRLQCRDLIHNIQCGSVLQCVAVCRSVSQCVAVYCSVLQCAAVCCSVLQCVAVGCTCVTAGSATRMPSYSDCNVETSSTIFGLSTQSHNKSHFSNPVFNCVAYEASFCIVILYTIQLFSVQEHNGFLNINTNVLRAAVVFSDVQYYLDSIHSIPRPFRLSHTFFGRGVGSNHVVKWQDQDTATHCNSLQRTEMFFTHTHNQNKWKNDWDPLHTFGETFQESLYVSTFEDLYP